MYFKALATRQNFSFVTAFVWLVEFPLYLRSDIIILDYFKEII